MAGIGTEGKGFLMHVVIIGAFPQEAKKSIRAHFPSDWTVNIIGPERAGEVLPSAEVVIPEHIAVDESFLARAPGLRLVQTGAGYDNVDLAACTRHGVLVCNAAGVNADAVAEHALAMILCWYKNLILLDGFMKQKQDMAALSYHGAELAGKTLGIIGYGHVGQKVARLAQVLSMNVLVFSHREVAGSGILQVGLGELCRKSDIVSVHMALRPETRHMIDAQAFAAMKQGALFVNTARGGLVDEAALVEALMQKRLAGACLDVFETEPLPLQSPLRDMANVILTPHTAGLPDGIKYHRQRYGFFLQNMIALEQGKRLSCQLNQVD